MHQRTWLSILTLPFVTAFTYPMVVRQATPAARVESAPSAKDPLAGLADVQDVLSLVRDNYVDVPDLEKVVRGGIEGVLEQAHPMNAYLTPEDVRLPDPGPGQVGLTVLKKTIWAQVVAVTPGSPAAGAGIQVGDVIRKIDGTSVGSMSAWTLERALKGSLGSKLELVRYDSSNGQLKTIALERAMIQRPALMVRRDSKATLVQLPDLTTGRASELRQALQNLDRTLPLVLDLRNCAGGDLAEAVQVAQVFGGTGGTLATVQETGKPDRPAPVAASASPGFGQIAVLLGLGTVGPAEGLASYLKKESVLTIGERSAGLGIERTRFQLRQGGAVELVNRRWLGAGGEKLDRQGVVPAEVLRGLQPGEDPLPKVLELLAAPARKAS